MKGINSYHHYLYREDIKYENHMFKSSKIFYVTLFLAMIFYDITIEKKRLEFINAWIDDLRFYVLFTVF